MISAYDKIYLENARNTLGRMLDFAVYDLNYELSDFWNMFLASGIADQFGSGDFTLLAGKSGVELAYEVLERSGISVQRTAPKYPVNRSEEYWTGWALAYYQWAADLRFSAIQKAVPIEEIAALYEPYHEMDIRQFVDKMNELYKLSNPDTNLKRLRLATGMSQRALAEQSGVPLRTIQQYEQRQKNINKAQGETLLKLAKPICCSMEDLLEKV